VVNKNTDRAQIKEYGEHLKQERYHEYMLRMEKEENKKSSFVVTLETDEDDNLILPIPIEIMNQMGWDIGDTLLFQDCFNGSCIITKG